MENLGIHLQNLREEKGISYQKVFESLRIREEQVRLIEENRFFGLGHFGFAKLMVYNYARYLEADLDEVMAEFNVMVPENTKKTTRRELEPKAHKIMLSPNLLWMLGIIVFVAILGAILWHAKTQGWLKNPNFLKSGTGDSTAVVKPQAPEEVAKKPEPDPMREVQKKVTQAAATQNGNPSSEQKAQRQASQDSTDHIGELLGASQVNLGLD